MKRVEMDRVAMARVLDVRPRTESKEIRSRFDVQLTERTDAGRLMISVAVQRRTLAGELVGKQAHKGEALILMKGHAYPRGVQAFRYDALRRVLHAAVNELIEDEKEQR